ncbi:MAG: AAA family ATPase, partial [Polyangiales bacterium]
MLFCFDDFALDPERLELRRAGVPVRIDALVVRLLSALVRDAGQLVTKNELIARVWDGRAVSDNVITVAMVRLRKTLGHKAGEREYVVNLHGRGYRFVRPVATREESGPSELVVATTRLGGPFVGREDLLETLRGALLAARAGSGGAVLLVGEAGLGKTRAAEILAAEASAAACTVAWGHCQEAGDTPPLWPIAQIVRELAPGIDPKQADAVRRLLPDPARAADALERTVPKHRLTEAVISLLTEAARARPVVLVLDDLHRADAASLELLGALLDRLARLR